MKRRRMTRGGSLVEVTVASALLAMAALSVIAALLAAIRSERDAVYREQAWLLADSWAETARSVGPAGIDWQAAVTALPHGKLALVGAGGGMATLRIEWAGAQPAAEGPSSCTGVFVTAGGVRCVALAFATAGGG
ncbi:MULTISPECIES: type IV pilus modification PilV family protein [Burkholderia]|uniref:type IV pilus modification PilV family protein n=1 Tax=Burkholderia TaxID=32008 RepID=UPI000F76854A|nr:MULTISPECIES: hypothetical protein [Burkholderia]